MRSKVSKRILSETPQETIDKVNEYSDGLISKKNITHVKPQDKTQAIN